jgi:uncharacterized protein DUF6265
MNRTVAMPRCNPRILIDASLRPALHLARAILFAASCAATAACAQAPAAPEPTAPAPLPATPAPTAPATPALPVTSPAAAADPLAALAWLHGCWAGNVNMRNFTEQWTAPAAGMMLGLGHTVMNGKTLSFEFMRIETRPDGKIAYVAKPTDKVEEGFVYEGTRDDRGMTGYVFSNPARDFPSQIIYQRSPRGELYAYVKGKINGADREVIYPFHAVDCASGKAQ